MESTFEKLGGTYIRCGDYFIPDIRLPQENRPIGKWGRLRKDYLRDYRPLLFSRMVLNGSLFSHLADINEQARQREGIMIQQMKEREGITEALKAADPMAWVGAMNNIASRVQEIILAELIYV